MLSLFYKTPFNEFTHIISSSNAINILILTFVTSTISTVIAFIFGTPLAYYLTFKKSKINRLSELLVDLPAVLPPAVAGIALLMAFGRQGLLGMALSNKGIQIPFTTAAVILAQLFVSSCYYIKAAHSAFTSVEPAIREESMCIGTSEWKMMTKIYIPITFRYLISGAISSWARAVGEFGATMLFAGNLAGKTQTMPLAIYSYMQSDVSMATSLSVLMVVSSIAIIWLVKFINSKLVY